MDCLVSSHFLFENKVPSLLSPSQAEHDVKDKSQLLSLIYRNVDGIAVSDLKDAYPNVMEDLQVQHKDNIFDMRNEILKHCSP